MALPKAHMPSFNFYKQKNEKKRKNRDNYPTKTKK